MTRSIVYGPSIDIDMGNNKLTNLADGVAADDAATVGQISDGDVAGDTHAASSKTTPVDADELPLTDSAASFGLKKLTWANLKATAKTYFDGIYDATGAAAAAQSASQPLDFDLSAIAALTTTSYGRAFLALADAAAARTAIASVIGTDVEAHDADLTTIAGLSPTNDDVLQRKAGAWTNRTIANLLTDLAAAGTTFQPLDSDLTSIAALSTTSFGRGLLAEASASTARGTLGIAGAVGGAEWTTVRKTLDESNASNTTAQDDDELFFTAASGSVYELQMVIIYGSPLGGATPDMKIELGEDATIRGAAHWLYVNSGETWTHTVLPTCPANQIAAGTQVANRAILVKGEHVGGGGTMKVKWAQNTSGTNATIVRAASILRYRVIA